MEKKKNKKATVIIISIFIVLILTILISYAYFTTELNGTEGIIKVGELELVLDETSEGISIDNAIGISDSEGLSLEGSTFKLINNGSKAVDYTIYLDDNTIGDNDTRIDDKYLKYNLVKNGASSSATMLTTIGANPNRVLDYGTIEGGKTNTYSLNLWITSDVNGNYSGQVFSGKLRVEVSQERPTVSEVLLADSSNNINTDDPEQTFITGKDPNNYIWYSGKLWRAVSIDPSDNSVKLVTQWNISTIPYDDDSSVFEGSYMEAWLNDTTLDGFLGNLRDYKNFIVTDAVWYATMDDTVLGSITRPKGTTVVTDAVGLLNMYEYQSSGGTGGYLNNGLYWWTITIYNSSSVRDVTSLGTNYGGTPTNVARSIRPSINLKSEVKVVAGSGTEDDPYRLLGDNDEYLNGTYLNSRYSGEYIRFGTGENNLYRIVSHETEGLTKITSAKPLKESGTIKTISFGDNVYYSKNNTIGNFLNGEYLTSTSYLTNKQVDMIEESTTWYLGTVKSGSSYKLAKYTDTNMSGYVTSTNAKVGLLRFGELMSGQFGKIGNSSTYFTLTPFSVSDIRTVVDHGSEGNYSHTSKMSIKPSLNLKSNVIITGGDGTLQNPFEIALQ